jgi:hypothetical protein
MSRETLQNEDGKEVTEAELVRSLMKQIKEGASPEVVLMGVPEELRVKIQEELDREKSAKLDHQSSSELIPTDYQGLTSNALDDAWIVEGQTVESEFERNKKILALERLRREESLYIQSQLKEIERAARRQLDVTRMGALRVELDVPGAVHKHFMPIVISEGELAELLSESTSRSSFTEHLKNKYQRRLEIQGGDLDNFVRQNPDAIPEFLRGELVEKYGYSQAA